MSFLTSRQQVAPQGIGKTVRRREDARFLTGAGNYADDMSLPGQAHAYVVRSPHAHAGILGIDIGPAACAPGVLAILTGSDAAQDGLQPTPQPEGIPPTHITMIVQVNGSGGNLASLPLRVIARALSARGYAALSISTRQHDEHVNTDNFFDVRQDIEAAVVTAKALGFRSIILQGHSLGTVQAAFYAASDWDPTIKAVILTGAFGKLRGSYGTS
jgi:predicted alpha/beta-fold hydrolase